MSAAFDRLSPAMQYQIVNGLGFTTLRPVQEASIAPIVDGKNCVVLAPTAGGKTEAAFFPLLSRMDAEDWRPVSVVYVAPIRALLNNQHERLSRYAELVGRRVFTWHGDTGPSARRAFVTHPTDILLTTPESLEVMLMSPRISTQRLFRALRAVVMDEIHAFAGDDRGGHLAAVMERLCRYCGHDVQRIGLSATVGNPEEILAWAAGSSRREGVVVRAPGSAAPPALSLDYVGSVDNAARVISALHPGRKRLVFVDSRRRVEELGSRLRDLGTETFVTHSSLAVSERRRAEQAFSEGRDCVIVSTSALELGIDIGDLDHVLQIDAPRTVAGFLQRLGRTGRRPGSEANCTFLATDDDALVQAAALIRLYRSGYVEPVRPRRRAVHLLAHQLLALTLQEQGVAESDWWGWVSAATPFEGLTQDDRAELVAHMVAEGILIREGGRLSLGPRGERLYGWRNFAELYAVFSAPETLTVLFGVEEIGHVEAAFLQAQEQGLVTFTLGARSWGVVAVDWERGLVHVQPVQSGNAARWQGRPAFLDAALCRAIRGVLKDLTDDTEWSRRAVTRMASVREEYEFLRASDGDVLLPDAGGYRLWTFAGGRANAVHAKTVESLLGERVTSDNFGLGFRDEAAASESRVRDALASLRHERRPNGADVRRFADACVRGRMSKFQPCLSPRLEAEYLAGLLHG